MDEFYPYVSDQEQNSDRVKFPKGFSFSSQTTGETEEEVNKFFEDFGKWFQSEAESIAAKTIRTPSAWPDSVLYDFRRAKPMIGGRRELVFNPLLDEKDRRKEARRVKELFSGDTND